MSDTSRREPKLQLRLDRDQAGEMVQCLHEAETGSAERDVRERAYRWRVYLIDRAARLWPDWRPR